jgi:hypothetical protein
MGGNSIITSDNNVKYPFKIYIHLREIEMNNKLGFNCRSLFSIIKNIDDIYNLFTRDQLISKLIYHDFARENQPELIYNEMINGLNGNDDFITKLTNLKITYYYKHTNHTRVITFDVE